MTNQIKHLPLPLRELAAKHFVLLESKNVAKKRDTIELNLSGYSDVMFLVADIVKVCILALDGENNTGARIPEPSTNISGVLSVILDLLPYEEADLLDKIREAVLEPETQTEDLDEYFLENLYLIMPTSIQ